MNVRSITSKIRSGRAYLSVLASIGRDRTPVRGPFEVMVDFCNNCNLHCLCCFNYSPLGPSRFSSEERRLVFPRDLFIRLLDDCKSLGVRYVNLAGGGEPLLHPDCAILLEEIAGRNLQAILTTSGVLLPRFPAVARAAARVSVSTLAGSESCYREMHPKDSPKCWKNVLAGLGMLKQAGVPTTITFVLCNRNFRDLEAVIDLAVDHGADLYIKALMPFIRESHGTRRLDRKHLTELQLSAGELRLLRDRCGELEQRASSGGIRMRGLRDSLVPVTRHSNEAGRREPRNSRGAIYDRQPCYTGWYFSRVMIDGTVTLCCHSLGGVSVGNLRKKRFREIWTSAEYNFLRAEGFRLPLSTSELWKRCNCRICDMTERNQRVHGHLNGVGTAGRLVSVRRRFTRT